VVGLTSSPEFVVPVCLFPLGWVEVKEVKLFTVFMSPINLHPVFTSG